MRAAFRIVFLASCATLLLAACTSGPKIRVDADPAANFASYKTFTFFEPLATNEAGYSTLLTSRLKDSTKRELEAKGYTQDDAEPDLRINFNVNVTDKTEVRSSPSASVGYGYYGYRSGMYGAWNGYPYDVQTTNYKQGTLTVDAVDAERKALVWQGVAEGRVSKSALENPAASIDAAIKQVFEKFPARNASAAAAD